MLTYLYSTAILDPDPDSTFQIFLFTAFAVSFVGYLVSSKIKASPKNKYISLTIPAFLSLFIIPPYFLKIVIPASMSKSTAVDIYSAASGLAVFLGIIFCIIGLECGKKALNDEQRGFAIAGIISNVVLIFLIFLIISGIIELPSLI